MKIITIAWKDALLRFSDRTELLFFIILPVVFTYLLSGGAPQASEDRIPLLVVDQDGTGLSAELVAALSNFEGLELRIVSPEEAERGFAEDEAPAWVTIPNGFERELLAGREGRLDLRRIPNDTRADAAERAISTAAGQVNRILAAARTSLAEVERIAPFSAEGERQAFFMQSLAEARKAFQSAPSRVTVTRPDTTGASNRPYDQGMQASAGQMITWVMIPLLGTSGLFAYERRQRTLQRMLTTSTQKAVILLGAIAGQLGMALVQITLLIGFGALVLGLPWGRSPAGLSVMALSFGLASVALGTMLGTFIKTEKQASNLSIMLGMVLALLGGCWWPIELFPQVMRTAALALPTTWAMQGFTDLALHSQGLVQILPAAAALLAFASLYFLVGILRFRYE